jgi:DNA-binding response OmpR family regulator
MNKGRILIIEDEAIVADDILYCLQEAGYEVPLVCASGEEALASLAKESVDLALVDILLAGSMDGIETARQLRINYQLPVVYLTSFTNESIIERAKSTTPTGYIVKPFKRRELLATVEMALYRGESAADALSASIPAMSEKWILSAWSKCLNQSLISAEKTAESLSGEALNSLLKQNQKTKMLATHLQYFAGLSSPDNCAMDKVLSLVENLFQIYHPERKFEFILEQEADSICCMPLLLIESLLSALDTLASIVPETDLLLRACLLAETESENFAENLVPEKQYCFQIRLKSSHGEIDKMLMTEFESSSAIVQISKTFEKTGGTMSSFSSELEGTMGINFNLRSMQEPQSGT